MKYKDLIKDDLAKFEFDLIVYNLQEWSLYDNYQDLIGSDSIKEDELDEIIKLAESGRVCYVHDIVAKLGVTDHIGATVLSYNVTFNNIKGMANEKTDQIMYDQSIDLTSVQEVSNEKIVVTFSKVVKNDKYS